MSGSQYKLLYLISYIKTYKIESVNGKHRAELLKSKLSLNFENERNHFHRRSAHSTRCPNSSSCGDRAIWPAKWTNALQAEYLST